jgi:hypothetical protein
MMQDLPNLSNDQVTHRGSSETHFQPDFVSLDENGLKIVHPLERFSLSKGERGQMERKCRKHTSMRATLPSFEMRSSMIARFCRTR